MAALTSDAAAILGLSGEVGVLAPGLRADVIVTDGSPLQIRTAFKRVIVGGRDVGLESRHTQLYERYRARLADPGRPSQ
jgi:imidazolonepropionase-like amidohydrolase